MRVRSLVAVALAVLAGIVVGAIGEAIYAQTKPPIYMVANIDVRDQDGYTKEYLPKAKELILKHGGVYVAAGKGTTIDGAPAGRVVILRWKSMEQLLEWRHSPEYEAVRKIGEKYATYNLMAVDGVQQK